MRQLGYTLLLALMCGAAWGVLVPQAELSLDIESGARQLAGETLLTYDSAWVGSGVSFKITANGGAVSQMIGVGSVLWSSRRPGEYVLEAQPYVGGALAGDPLTATLEVKGHDLVRAQVEVLGGVVLYDGTARTPKLNIVLDGQLLVEGVDYALSYESNVGPGQGKAIVTGLGAYQDDVTSIVRVVKNKGVTAARQIAEDAWKNIIKDGGNYPSYLTPHITGNTAYLDAFRYAFWFAGQRASVCFARQVLLVEGATEAALFARLQDDDKLHLPRGTVVVDCMGKFNFHRFMAVMRGWGIPFAVVYDDDSGKSGDKLAEHKAWNKFVEATAKRSKANILALKGDLEETLGVAKFGRDRLDLKPYHLLNEYEKGKCKGLDELCRKIEGLFKGLKVA